MDCKLCAGDIESGADIIQIALGVCDLEECDEFLCNDIIGHAHIECFEEKYGVHIHEF